MIEACQKRGFPYDPDYNDGSPNGTSFAETTQKYGRRWSAADAFLRPAAGRPNLTILTAATALGLELADGRVRGVKLGGKTPMAVARARREVILSAGAIGSPQLLMLSGIGDPEKLRAIGVDPAVDAPAVGTNLQDHPFQVGIWDAPIGGSLADAEKPAAIVDFLTRRRGPLDLARRRGHSSSPAPTASTVRPTSSSTSPPPTSRTTGSRSTTDMRSRSAPFSSHRALAASSI